MSFENAVAKVHNAARSNWDVVAGPAASVVATMSRIKWVHNGPFLLSDDLGRIFNCKLDPPVVIGSAVKASVRRWRLALVIRKYPALCPARPDYVDPRMSEQFIRSDGLLPQGTIELSGAFQKLLDC